jgi:hypothetical protein
MLHFYLWTSQGFLLAAVRQLSKNIYPCMWRCRHFITSGEETRNKMVFDELVFTTANLIMFFGQKKGVYQPNFHLAISCSRRPPTLCENIWIYGGLIDWFCAKCLGTCINYEWCIAPVVWSFFLSTTAQLYTTHRKGGRRRKRHFTSAQEWGHGGVAWGNCVSQAA